MSNSKKIDTNNSYGRGFSILATIVLCCLVTSLVTYAAARYSVNASDAAAIASLDNIENLALENLRAQQAMAFWAAWMFVITSATVALTVWALFYIRGTLAATQEALIETSDATKAIVEQNKLTEQVQRPWVSVTVRPKLLCRTGAAVRIEYDIDCLNLGKLPAKNYQLRRLLTWVPETTGAPDDPFSQLVPIAGSTRKVILPGDVETFRDWRYQAIDTIPKNNTETGGDIVPILIISVFYQSEVTGDQWLRTDKAYFVAHRASDQRLSARYRRDFEESYLGVDLVMEAITSATLAD